MFTGKWQREDGHVKWHLHRLTTIIRHGFLSFDPMKAVAVRKNNDSEKGLRENKKRKFNIIWFCFRSFLFPGFETGK